MKKKLFALLMSSALGVTLLTGCPAKQNPEPGPKEDVTVVDDFYPEESDKPIEDLDNTPMSEVPQDLIDDLEEATGADVDVSVIIEAGLSEEQLRTLIHLMNLVKDGDAFESKQILTDALYDILALIKSMTPDQIRYIHHDLEFFGGQTTIEDMFSYRVRGTSPCWRARSNTKSTTACRQRTCSDRPC